MFCSVLYSLAVFDPRVRHIMHIRTCSIFLCPVILIDSSTGNFVTPVHVLMLSIQAVRCVPRLRAPGIVLCIISFSRQLPCFLMV